MIYNERNLLVYNMFSGTELLISKYGSVEMKVNKNVQNTFTQENMSVYYYAQDRYISSAQNYILFIVRFATGNCALFIKTSVHYSLVYTYNTAAVVYWT